jgi:hypothetical protein
VRPLFELYPGARHHIAVSNSLRDRQEKAALPPSAGPWLEYLNDVVRSARDQVFTPPGTALPPEGLSS